MQKEGNSNKQNHVSFPEFQENGLSKQLSDDYIYEVMQDNKDDLSNSLSRKSTNNSDGWEDGLTFCVKGSSEYLTGIGDNKCFDWNWRGFAFSTLLVFVFL